MKTREEISEGLIIKRLNANDTAAFTELIKVFEDVFEMSPFKVPGAEYLGQLLRKDNFNVFVAILEEQVIGGLTSYVLDQYYAEHPLAYIFDLAVLTDYQRLGIGQALIAETNAFYKQQGFEEVFVQADKIDAYAIDFYRKTNPTAEEQVVHFYYTLNPK